jgi:predicted NBD/HSP70 family sugar kinase
VTQTPAVAGRSQYVQLTDRAAAVAGRMCQSKGTQFDPSLILVVIGVIVDAVKLWRQCHQTTHVAEAARRAGPLFRRRVWSSAHAHLQAAVKPVDLAQAMTDEVIAEMGRMSDGDVRQVVREIETKVLA